MNEIYTGGEQVMGTRESAGRTIKNKLMGAARAVRQPEHAASATGNPSVTVCDDLQQRIALRAYELYEGRGYGHGYALDDWIQAEREVLRQIPPVQG
jgi:hypothetical protein